MVNIVVLFISICWFCYLTVSLRKSRSIRKDIFLSGPANEIALPNFLSCLSTVCLQIPIVKSLARIFLRSSFAKINTNIFPCQGATNE